MISLCIPPLSRGQNLSHNLASLPPLFLNLLRDLFGLLLLLCGVVEYPASVLRTGVWTLAVGRRGVVHLVEEFEEGGVAYFFGVEGYLEGFGVCLGFSLIGVRCF